MNIWHLSLSTFFHPNNCLKKIKSVPQVISHRINDVHQAHWLVNYAGFAKKSVHHKSRCPVASDAKHNRKINNSTGTSNRKKDKVDSAIIWMNVDVPVFLDASITKLFYYQRPCKDVYTVFFFFFFLRGSLGFNLVSSRIIVNTIWLCQRACRSRIHTYSWRCLFFLLFPSILHRACTSFLLFSAMVIWICSLNLITKWTVYFERRRRRKKQPKFMNEVIYIGMTSRLWNRITETPIFSVNSVIRDPWKSLFSSIYQSNFKLKSFWIS